MHAEDTDWMVYIDGEVRDVCQATSWGHQLRRKWTVREKPVADSGIDDYEWKLIPGGVDLATFSPGPKAAARRALGLAPDGHVALFVANQGMENAFKDFPTVRAALVELSRRAPEKVLDLLVVGSDGPEERISAGIAIRPLEE